MIEKEKNNKENFVATLPSLSVDQIKFHMIGRLPVPQLELSTWCKYEKRESTSTGNLRKRLDSKSTVFTASITWTTWHPISLWTSSTSTSFVNTSNSLSHPEMLFPPIQTSSKHTVFWLLLSFVKEQASLSPLKARIASSSVATYNKAYMNIVPHQLLQISCIFAFKIESWQLFQQNVFLFMSANSFS